MVFVVVSILDDDDDSVPKRFFSGILLAWLFRKDGKEDATALRRSINTSRQREFYADFSFFPFLSPKKRHFFLEKTNHIKDQRKKKKKKFLSSSFAEKSEKCHSCLE